MWKNIRIYFTAKFISCYFIIFGIPHRKYEIIKIRRKNSKERLIKVTKNSINMKFSSDNNFAILSFDEFALQTIDVTLASQPILKNWNDRCTERSKNQRCVWHCFIFGIVLPLWRPFYLCKTISNIKIC